MPVVITDTVIKVGGVQVVKAQEAVVAAVSAATATSIAATMASAAPAGGTGATAGAYDTAANRDLMITSQNALITWATEMDLDYEALVVDVADIRTKVNSILTKLKTHGLIASA